MLFKILLWFYCNQIKLAMQSKNERFHTGTVGSSQPIFKLDDDSEGNLVPKDEERSCCVPTGTANVLVAMANIKIIYKIKPFISVPWQSTQIGLTLKLNIVDGLLLKLGSFNSQTILHLFFVDWSANEWYKLTSFAKVLYQKTRVKGFAGPYEKGLSLFTLL